MRAQIKGLGTIGVIQDIAPEDIPLQAWSAVQNIRCQLGQAGTISGYAEYTTPTVTPYFILPYPQTADFYWIYAGLAKIYQFNGSTHSDITRQTAATDVDYTGSATDRWNGYIFGGVPILNNGVDNPQYFNGTLFADMIWDGSNTWDDVSKLARVIVPYKYYLVALNVYESGTWYPFRVLWSNPADPGSMPDSWDYTSATNSAGFNDILDTPGHLIDAATLRDTLILYKEDAVWAMQWVEDSSVFNFYRVGDMPGILAQGCVIEVANAHIVLSRGDLYSHDGQSWQSIVSQRVRRALFDDLDPDNYASCYLVKHSDRNEVWVCYPTSGNTLPNKRLVWNYELNTFSFCDLPAATAHIARGVLITSAYTWDSLPFATWDDWTGTWGSRVYTGAAHALVAASDKLYSMETGNTADGTAIECILERTGLALGDPGDIILARTIFPRVEGAGPVNVYIGSHEVPGGGVTWEGPYAFTPATDYKIDCSACGPFLAVKFQSNADVSWAVSDIALDFVKVGAQ